VIMHGENSFNGVPVRFVETNVELLREVKALEGSRMAELMVESRQRP
jgi:hypothetical protein